MIFSIGKKVYSISNGYPVGVGLQKRVHTHTHTIRTSLQKKKLKIMQHKMYYKHAKYKDKLVLGFWLHKQANEENLLMREKALWQF